MRIKLLIGLILAGGGIAYLSHAQSKSKPVPSSIDIRGGGEIYAQNCADCHGADMRGGAAKSLVDRKLEFVSSTEAMKALIRDGDEEMGMPPFAAAMNEAELQKLVEHIAENIELANVTPATDADQIASDELKIDVMVTGLDEPWGMQFLSPSHALVTEKKGPLRQIIDGRLQDEPVSGTPEVWSGGQGGLLDVAIDPDYAENKWIYLAFSHPIETGSNKAMTKLIRGRITDSVWQDEEVLFAAKPEHYVKGRVHFGSRITFDDKGHLFFSIGDRGKKDMAQDITRPNGKVHRINRDGSIPKDNPFVSKTDTYPSIFSYGNRNPQGLIYAGGKLWETEHGPKGGDELNHIMAGVNYGWPVISYGRNYNGTELTPYTHKEGMKQPVSQWTPSIAACGLDVYRGALFSDWQGDLLVGALRYEELRLIELEDGEYAGERILLKGKGRVRDVTIGPDGAIYVVLNGPGQILRLTPSTFQDNTPE